MRWSAPWMPRFVESCRCFCSVSAGTKLLSTGCAAGTGPSAFSTHRNAHPSGRNISIAMGLPGRWALPRFGCPFGVRKTCHFEDAKTEKQLNRPNMHVVFHAPILKTGPPLRYITCTFDPRVSQNVDKQPLFVRAG